MSDRDTFVFHDFRLHVARRELTARGMQIPLGPRAFDLLLALVRRQGQLATKDELIAEVWPRTAVEESNLHVQISALRRVLGEDRRDKRYVVTIPGRGYRFVAPVEVSADDTAAGSDFSAPPLPDKPSIAVLPFSNLSNDLEQNYLADGMAEEILTALARCAGLFVIARNSSFSYKHNAVDIRQVGRELGVRYLLEGSVRYRGNRLRVASQLIDATCGAQIWAERFEGDLNDVFDLQDRIAATVVGSIEPTMQLAEIEHLKHNKSADLNAYGHLLRAQQLEHEFTQQSLESALQHLRQAIDIDTSYAPAMAFAAYCHGWRVAQSWASDVAAESARGLGLISRALELGKFDANVVWMCAFAASQFGLDDNRVLELAYRSLEMNPNSAIALTVAGRIEVLSGNYSKGEQLLLRSQRLSPRDPRAWFNYQGMALACLGAGQYEEGASWARKAIGQSSRFANAIRILAVHLAYLGRISESREAAAESLRIDPSFTISNQRSRLKFIHERFWKQISEGLRRAGLPE